MNKNILTFAFLTIFSTFTIASYASSIGYTSPNTECDGGHECTDKCKKDKDGKCAEAKSKNQEGEKAGCCKKDDKSCKNKKEKHSQKNKKVSTDES